MFNSDMYFIWFRMRCTLQMRYTIEMICTFVMRYVNNIFLMVGVSYSKIFLQQLIFLFDIRFHINYINFLSNIYFQVNYILIFHIYIYVYFYINFILNILIIFFNIIHKSLCICFSQERENNPKYFFKKKGHIKVFFFTLFFLYISHLIVKFAIVHPI